MNFSGFINTIIKSVLNPLVVLITAVALVVFLWGAVQLITAEDDKRKEAIKKVTFGLIALAIMIGVWGLVKIILDTFPDLNFGPPNYDKSKQVVYY